MSDILRDFDKKNEFPKVSIDRMKIGGKELAEELANNILNGKFDLGIEKIARDIVKRQDNAMAMEFTECIAELLRKNGVVPKITEYTSNFETENTFKARYGVIIDELDFSEHDKVFEDKIASLEKQIEKLKGEKSFLRTRCMPYIERDFNNGLYEKIAIVGCNEEFVDIQKYADGDDLYSIEVRNLISEGGIKRLIGQYRNISARLDKMSAENRGLQKNVKDYEDKISKIEKDVASYKQAFEDKCADYGTVSELLGKYQQENEGLKQRIAELESNETENISEIDTSNPLACAESLIEHMTHCEKFMIMPERDVQTFSVEELKEIADYLMVYYRHHRDRDD